MRKKLFVVLAVLLYGLSFLGAEGTAEMPNQMDRTISVTKSPKYVFMFIGDGMSHVQINAAEVFNGNNTKGDIALSPLSFTEFPVLGLQTTYDATSFCPDSASTATSLSSGIKTHSGVLGMGVDKTTKTETIAEKLKRQKDWKIGIISTVTLNHATPAAYYAHVPSRNNYYDIGLQMVDSGFDYFAGGAINMAADKGKTSIYDLLEAKGYTVLDSKDSIESLNSNSGKVYAQNPRLQDSGSMPYSLDMDSTDLTLADFVRKGIDVLDNEKGFFMMCESGKIDWACHANDAAAEISDLLAFDKAVQVAIDFAKKHPRETLIVVTGDHETGGMTIGYASTGYNTAFEILKSQKLSYVAFDTIIKGMKQGNTNPSFDEVMALVTEDFGLVSPNGNASDKALVLTEGEYSRLKEAYAQSMLPSDKRSKDDVTALLYGGYDPLSVTITHILNNKAGIGWTSYSHTGTPVSVYASGVGEQAFSGSYDNTDIYYKLRDIVGVN
ncbi:alkaline phosphatase [uncultured Sphaerochaeta sp.]|uniref:alkaline phosphatase n=1 Tax=uncultured Sphaerochaeta sp. TaxID=886478 RepID=UPI002A0A761F|nr:alkaline phosphatase [uncultured Sphaerochaeta sp.]